MTDTIALIISLIVISGVTAYVGDLLGTYIGKKRLSLFGTRPKRTGQIIGIGAGMAIALMTLGVSALVFRGAVRTIFNAQSVSQRLAKLEVQEKSLSGQVELLEGQMTTTTEQLEQAKTTIFEAERQRDAAQLERDTAKKEVAALDEERTTLEADSKKLQTNLTTLQAQFTNATNKLTEAEDELADIQDELASADEQRDSAVAEAKQATDAAAAATQEVAELKTQIDTVQADLKTRNAELAAQTEALTAAQTKLGTAQNELATAQLERDQALEARNAATTQIETLQATRDGLNTSLQTIQRQVDDYEQRAEDLKVQNDDLTVKNETLLEQSATLSAANDTLKTDNETLTNDIRIQNEQADLLKGQVAGLNDQLEEQARELEIVTEQMRAVNSGEITYSINEAIHNGVISSQDPIEIRAELAQLFLSANNKTAQRGAGQIEPRTEQLENLVLAISESPDADIVTLRSPYNQFKGAPVTVDVEAMENQRLAQRGQLVVSRQIHLGSDLLRVTSDEVSGKVRDLVRDANDKLLGLGLADNVDTSAADTSSLSLEAFSNDLERLTGVVTIGLVASDEVFRSGPVKLSFVIIN